MIEAAKIMGAAVGRPHVTYFHVPPEEARIGMLAGGMSPSFADDVLETARSFNADEPWALEKRTPDSTTSTSLERWSRETLVDTEVS